jgi:predicted CXXCH cytochrome family protein
MHYSQGNEVLSEWGNDGPYGSLLVDDCQGCHTGTNDGTNTTPYVYSTIEPTFGSNTLAGGNFYWVKNVSDAKGHNIFLGESDSDLDRAPGSGDQIVACGYDNCHANLSAPFRNGVSEFEGKYGCAGCHLRPAHHADDTGPVVDSAEQGWYRFLAGHDSGDGLGVTGIEDDDWQYTKSASDHNEYLGISGIKTEVANLSRLPGAMTGYCAGCHGLFHVQQQDGAWIRHPSDAVIPNEGEYAKAFGATGGVGTYDPDVPVARPNLTGWTLPSTQVTMGVDMVMCLSCHVPHASPYDDLLRWDYDRMVAGGGGDDGTGCFVCHTNKDDQ